MKTEIVVEVSGGVVTGVYVNEHPDDPSRGNAATFYNVSIVDHDDIEQGGEPPTPETLSYMTEQYSIL